MPQRNVQYCEMGWRQPLPAKRATRAKGATAARGHAETQLAMKTHATDAADHRWARQEKEGRMRRGKRQWLPHAFTRISGATYATVTLAISIDTSTGIAIACRERRASPRTGATPAAAFRLPDAAVGYPVNGRRTGNAPTPRSAPVRSEAPVDESRNRPPEHCGNADKSGHCAGSSAPSRGQTRSRGLRPQGDDKNAEKNLPSASPGGWQSAPRRSRSSPQSAADPTDSAVVCVPICEHPPYTSLLPAPQRCCCCDPHPPLSHRTRIVRDLPGSNAPASDNTDPNAHSVH